MKKNVCTDCGTSFGPQDKLAYGRSLVIAIPHSVYSSGDRTMFSPAREEIIHPMEPMCYECWSHAYEKHKQRVAGKEVFPCRKTGYCPSQIKVELK